MTRTFLTASAALASMISVAACSGEGNEQRAPDQTMQPVNAVQDAAAAAVGAGSAALASRDSAAFVAAAAISDMYEIESSRMAVGRSSNVEVKKYAQMMIDDHAKTSAELKTLAGGVEGAKLPTEMDQRRQGMLDNLRGASPVDFDNTYLDQQTAAHAETVALMNGYGEGGDNAGLKAFAAKTGPIVEAHLQMARRLDSAGKDDAAAANSEGANGAGQMPAGESGQTQ